MAEKRARRDVQNNFGDDQDESVSSLSQDEDTDNQDDSHREDEVDAQATEENEESADDGFTPERSPEPEKRNKMKEQRTKKMVVKVKEMLRQSNENALNINNRDLDKTFNM